MGERRDYIDIVAGPGAGYVGYMGITRVSRGTTGLVQSVDGAAPIAFGGPAWPNSPSILYEADNIDGTNNSSLVDGQTIGTWKNLGTVGAAGDLLQATAGIRPFYRAIAVAGKMNNKPGVQSDGTRWMSTGAITAFTQPSLLAVVSRSETIPAVEFQTDGRNGGGTARQTLLSQTGVMQMASNSIVNIGTIQAAKFHSINANFNGASSQGRVDGVAGGVVNAGIFTLDGVTLFSSNAASGVMSGYILAFAAWTGASQPSPAAVEAFITAKWGITPQ